MGACIFAVPISLRVTWDMLRHGKEHVREYRRWRREHRNDINGMYVNKEGKIVLVKRFDEKQNEIRSPD